MSRIAVLLLLVHVVVAPSNLHVALKKVLLAADQIGGLDSVVTMGKAVLSMGNATVMAVMITHIKLAIDKARSNPEQAPPPRAPRALPNRRRTHLDWSKLLQETMNPAEFRNAFGIARSTFETLLASVRDCITDAVGWGGVRGNVSMPPELKLGMTLRWLRGGMYNDLIYWYGCSKTTSFAATARVLRVPARRLCGSGAGCDLDRVGAHKVVSPSSRFTEILSEPKMHMVHDGDTSWSLQ